MTELKAFCDEVRAGLAPADAVEAVLADRAALLMWRLRRPAVFEAAEAHHAAPAPRPLDPSPVPPPGPPYPPGHPVAELEGRQAAVRTAAAAVQRDLDLCRRLQGAGRAAKSEPVAPADAVHLLTRLHLYQNTPWDPAASPTPAPAEFLADAVRASGMPEEWRPHFGLWTGWTVGHLRNAIEQQYLPKWRQPDSPAAVVRVATAMLAAATAASADLDSRHAAAVTAAEARAAEAATPEGRAAAAGERANREAAHSEWQRRTAARLAVLEAEALSRLVRQEGHLQRQLDLTLRQLERRQAARRKAAEAAEDRGTKPANPAPDGDGWVCGWQPGDWERYGLKPEDFPGFGNGAEAGSSLSVVRDGSHAPPDPTAVPAGDSSPPSTAGVPA